MNKATLTIKTTAIYEFDRGAVPAGLLKDLIERQGDGFSFDGNWSIGDIKMTAEATVIDSVEFS